MSSDACALAAAHAAGEHSVLDTVEATLARIARRDPALGAFAGLESERALERASELDRARARGEACGPLFGVPLARKANLCRAGVETHCGSAILSGWTPPYEATALARLQAAGAIVIGATHMDEFGMGSSGENGPFPPARNPWDPTRTPGGSSSGAASAVAGGLVPLALGSDTGGSLRQPASFSGIVGLRPTWGRVSRRGLVAFASSLDQVGSLSRSVRDARRVLDIIGGRDAGDPTTFDPSGGIEVGSRRSLAGLRFGIPRGMNELDLDPAVLGIIEHTFGRIENRGASLVPVDLPPAEPALFAYYVIATVEASSNLARFDGVGFGKRAPGAKSLEEMMERTRADFLGDEVKRRILLGTHALSAQHKEAWYTRAEEVRKRVGTSFAQIFGEVDFVLGPAAPTTAFPLGERTQDPLEMYASDTWTIPPSLASLPAVSIPAGMTTGTPPALPVGLQIVAPRGADEDLLAVAEAVEETLAFEARPELAS